MLASIGVIQACLMIVVAIILCAIVLFGGTWVGRKLGLDPTLMNVMSYAVIFLVIVTVILWLINVSGCNWREWDIPISGGH